jgi:hypothetical protein
MSKGKKRTAVDFWSQLTPITKMGAVVGALAVILGTTWSGYQFTRTQAQLTFGKWPYGSAEAVEALAQYNVSELTAKQIGRQIEIDRLKEKCRRGLCGAYEQGVLRNLIADWERDQKLIDRLRGIK